MTRPCGCKGTAHDPGCWRWQPGQALQSVPAVTDAYPDAAAYGVEVVDVMARVVAIERRLDRIIEVLETIARRTL